MLAPVDYGNIVTALGSPVGWIELGVVGACFAGGWLLDRRVHWKSSSEERRVRVGVGGVNRLLFPVTTLVLLLLAGAIFRLWHAPYFIPMALTLTIALAAIRLVVYAMRELFGAPSWLPASERAVAFTIWGLVLLYFTGVLPEVAVELQGIEVPIGAKHISVYEIVRATIAVLLTLTVTLWLSGMVEARLMRAPNLDSNVRTVMSKFLRALLLIIGILFALQAVGLDLTLLSVFGGALGVGIGLGLQKLASNYIAGFTILLDRSIRLGDLITVDNRQGIVSKVTSRYVVVTNLDGIEAIVPNETLITTTVLNHSYSNPDVRVGIPVQVSYDSDIDLALKLLEDAAKAEPRVLKQDPKAPAAAVVRFAENGIDLELGVWISDPGQGSGNLRSSINRRVWSTFRENGIKIPFPQREYRILGMEPPRSGEAGGEKPDSPPQKNA